MRGRPSYRPLPFVALLAGAALVLLAACGGDDNGFAERVEDPFAGGYPMYRDGEGVQVIAGTPDLGTGERRVSFSLFARASEHGNPGEISLISRPEVDVRTYYYPDGASGEREGPIEERTLEYGELPPGGRGLYRGPLTFERSGLYGIEIDLPVSESDGSGGSDDGDVHRVLFPLEVAETPGAPDIGDPAPASEHPRLAGAGGIEELTTSWEPDPALYEVSIAEALAAQRPFVVVFTSPAFCTTALCGPQAELLSELAAEHQGLAEFIHVDLYENPHEIQGDLDRAVPSPLLAEWGIESDQWTFVVDGDGRITARFEGFVPRDELEPALLDAANG